MANPVPADFNFDIRETTIGVIAGAGNGYVTNEPIGRGQLILTERPWIRLCSNTGIVPPQYTDHQAWASLRGPLHPEYDRFIFNALRCGVYRSQDSTEERPALGIFLRAAGFNSSCVPNLHAHWNGITMEFRAIRDIRLGEELVIPYDAPTLLYSGQDRRARILQHFGFICNCPKCRIFNPQSDARRVAVRAAVREGQSDVQEIRSALIDLDREGLHHYKDTLLYDLYLARLAAGDNNAMLSCRDARNWARYMVGANDPRVQWMTNLLPLHLR